MSEYIHRSHNVSVLLYHFVCPAKYRRVVFSEAVDQSLKEICLEISKRYEIAFIEIGTDKNHVHFLIQSIPMKSPARIIQAVKSITAKEIFKLHPEVKAKPWGGEFWTKGYYVNTVGRPEHDHKLQTLLSVINNKMEHPINGDNRKILIFTAFSDTSEYLYEHVNTHVKQQYGFNTALVSGSVEGRSTCTRLRNDMNTVLTCFSPISKQKELVMPGNHHVIDLLIATDCISEGQNLQDCDYLINYDIHWNPVRIIQRFGRIDRIGSRNEVIQLVNFWPDLPLDDYINLKAMVETRMKISVMTATGDDNPISEEEKGDLEYRKQQLRRLMDEVVDIEEMNSGISIMDLGLNEFRLDLLDYMKTDPDIHHAPFGLHAIVEASDDVPEGVFYILKNISNGVNIDNQNRLHPFYMVYISSNEEVICNHLSPKKLLDLMRHLCKGESEPILDLCRQFNLETQDGRKMDRYSRLLESAIGSIVQVKTEKEIESFFTAADAIPTGAAIKGLHDFEMICFLVVKHKSS